MFGHHRHVKAWVVSHNPYFPRIVAKAVDAKRLALAASGLPFFLSTVNPESKAKVHNLYMAN